ncbi:MAG TPA: FAD:protein FMN transferase [Candidatus Choladousia intestinipullorum]|nr:FAD:protein FMN transferase [Candidatus Choladousia intestinipullorum]
MQHKFYPKIVLLPVVLAALLATACQRTGTSDHSSGSVSRTGFFFDTVVSLTVNGTDDDSVLDECFTLMENYEAMLSRTRENSDVWKINHSSGKPVTVSDETASLLSLAMKYSELSDGAFDITIAPYVELWDFKENPGTVPSEADLAEAGSHVGISSLRLDGNTVTLDDPEAAVDLGAIAKGYIADRVKEFLTSQGVESALINLGGNVLTIGNRSSSSPWNIGIRDPLGDSDDIITSIRISGKSVVTSGTYERYFEKDGVRYHHILDPKTGLPVQNGLESVTILSNSSAEGDALSTSCFVLGLEKGMELVESLDGTEALFITDEQELCCSDGFPKE